jgi:predicted NAD/FAD-binding protein
MNRLQPLGHAPPVFVTLNPQQSPQEESVIRRDVYEHPVFDVETDRAQREIWQLQGRRGTWFCGAHFGAGFHEDGLQAGLAGAEDLGGLRRPWTVDGDSARIVRGPTVLPAELLEVA